MAMLTIEENLQVKMFPDALIVPVTQKVAENGAFFQVAKLTSIFIKFAKNGAS